MNFITMLPSCVSQGLGEHLPSGLFFFPSQCLLRTLNLQHGVSSGLACCCEHL